MAKLAAYGYEWNTVRKSKKRGGSVGITDSSTAKSLATSRNHDPMPTRTWEINLVGTDRIGDRRDLIGSSRVTFQVSQLKPAPAKAKAGAGTTYKENAFRPRRRSHVGGCQLLFHVPHDLLAARGQRHDLNRCTKNKLPVAAEEAAYGLTGLFVASVMHRLDARSSRGHSHNLPGASPHRQEP